MKLFYSILFCFAAFSLQACHAYTAFYWTTYYPDRRACEIVDNVSGIINFESRYRRMDNFTGCWLIKPPKDSYIYLSFKELNLNDPYCDSAYIEFYDVNLRKREKICQYEYRARYSNWTKTALSDVKITIKLRNTWDWVSFKLMYKTESTICTQKDHFRCSPNHCIHTKQVCDGTEHCDDGSDERNCTGIVKVKGANATRANAIKWLKSRQSDFGWGKNTHRAITALYLTGAAKFQGNKVDEEMMVKQLQLKTAAALLRNSTYPVSANELSMFVNALSVTCHNYRNFYGYDLLKLLAKRTFSSSSPSPGAYLTLCNSKWPFSEFNVRQLLKLLTKDAEYPFHFEIQAMTVMALSCIKDSTDLFYTVYNASYIYNETIDNFIANQQPDGSFGNAHTTAMVTQAILSSGRQESMLWSANNATEFLIKNFNSSSTDFLSVYLTLPLLTRKTLVDIGDVDCSEYQRKLQEDDDISDIMDKLGSKIYVQYSLYVGDHKDVIHTIYLRVPENSTAYDIMRVAQVVDPKYKFAYHKANDHVYIYEIAGITNDMEVGKFWFFYTTHSESSSKEHLLQFTTSPDQVTLANKEHLILWYRTATI